ncbi:MAG: hypothetical protein ACFFCS_03060 [Candidatus Hodarchaeota archaeon]
MCAKKSSSADEKIREKALKVIRKTFEEKLNRDKKGEYVLPDGALPVEEISPKEAYQRILEISKGIYDLILQTGRPYLDVPSRSASNIIYDEENDLLLLGEDKFSHKIFHSLASVEDLTRLIRVMEVVHELLGKGKHSTKRELFYTDVNLFKQQTNSDNCIEDLSTLLHTVRNSTNIIASPEGQAVGRLRVKDKNNFINLEEMGSGSWSITPMLDSLEIVESDAEFILVLEKKAAMNRFVEEEWWKKYPCIIISGKGVGDVATRSFLRRLEKELNLPIFCLVDSDPYGHYIYSVYIRGSKKLSYESPFLATPGMHLLGVLTRDLDKYKIPKSVRIPMTKTDIKRCKEMLDEEFIKSNKKWYDDLKLMLERKEKAEIQGFAAHGFEYLTDEYLPSKLSTGDWI